MKKLYKNNFTLIIVIILILVLFLIINYFNTNIKEGYGSAANIDKLLAWINKSNTRINNYCNNSSKIQTANGCCDNRGKYYDKNYKFNKNNSGKCDKTDYSGSVNSSNNNFWKEYTYYSSNSDNRFSF